MTDGTVVDVASVLAGVREVAETRIAPGAAEVDRSRSFPDADIEALAGVGALGLLVPVEHGGAGGSLRRWSRRARSSVPRAPRRAWSS